jgi:hypothetical protein
MNDELKRILKEAVMAYSRNYPGTFLEVMRKIRATDVLTEIRAVRLTNR